MEGRGGVVREREGNIGVWCGTREGGQYRGVAWYERGRTI